MELKPGYKKTEVGVIPDDWEVFHISDLAKTSSGTTPARALRDRYYKNGSIAWVKTMDLNNSEIFETSELVTKIALEETCLRLFPAGTVLVAMYGGFQQIGRTALLRVPATVNQAITSIQSKPNKLISEYLLANFNYRIEYWKSVASSSRKDPNITSNDIRNFPVACPHIDEQNIIATALGDMDALLKSLDRLIAKKRDIKQAAMQQLLTGKTRLPGFEGEWEVKRLGELGVFLKGSGIKKDESQSGDIPCVRYGEIYTYHNDHVRQYKSWVSPQIATTATRLQQGDLLFAGSGETKEEIGKCVAFLDNFEAYAGGDIVILRQKENDPVFMGYRCNVGDVKVQKSSKGQGDAVVHISATALSDVGFPLPCLKEQTAIAAVLSDMDAEISALEKRRVKTADIKQAMMQELLTGKTRLIT